jgi:H+/Cl- antiporter ClcA
MRRLRAAFLLMPLGFVGLRWLTLRFSPQARGSGIPQVVAAMSLPAASEAQSILVSIRQSLWKIVLTAGGLLAGASIGREGLSVQVGAAVMLASFVSRQFCPRPFYRTVARHFCREATHLHTADRASAAPAGAARAMMRRGENPPTGA